MTEIHDPDELIELGAQLGGQATNATERDPAAFDRAIETYTVALTALPPDDRRVTKVAAALGTLRGFKYVLFGGPDTDLDEAITTLDEVKENEAADEKFVAAAHAMRGVLRLLRVYPMLRESDLTLRRLFENASPADERDREDVLRASADLSVAASANGVLPDRLRDLADLTQIGADLFLEVAASSGGNPSIDSMARLINEGLARLDPGVQGYTEMTIAAVWTKCMQRLEAGEPAVAPVADLQSAISQLEDGHVLGPILLAQTAAYLAERVFGEAVDGDHEVAAELLNQAWQGLRPLADHPMWQQTLRNKAGLSIVAEILAPTTTGGGIDEARELVDLLPDRRDQDDPADSAAERFLQMMVEFMGAHRDRRPADYPAVSSDLDQAVNRLSEEHELRPRYLTVLAALLGDEWLVRSGLEKADASAAYFGLARRRLDSSAGSGGQDTLGVRGLSALLRVFGEHEGLDAAVDELAATVDGLPKRHVLWPYMSAGLGIARFLRGIQRDDIVEIRLSALIITDAADAESYPEFGKASMIGISGLAWLLVGITDDDETVIEKAIGRLRDAAGRPGFLHGEEARIQQGLGNALLMVDDHRGGRENLDQAIAHLERAREMIGDEPANPIRGKLLSDLATAVRERARRDGDGEFTVAIEAGLSALRAFEDDVLLQTTAEHGLTMARRAASFAYDVTGWCLEVGDLPGAVRAVEHGRGLLLNAATSAVDAPELLRAARRRELADEWQRTQGGILPAIRTSMGDAGESDVIEQFVVDGVRPQIPSDLRYRVLSGLAEVGRRPMPEPSPDAIAAALRRVGADAMVYLLPGKERVVSRMLVLRDDATIAEVGLPDEAADPEGRVHTYAITPHGTPDSALTNLCDWAWTAVVQPLLGFAANWALSRPPRLVMVSLGPLGMIPWHAARDTTDGRPPRYSCQDAVFSYIASGRQLIEVTRRTRRPPDGDPVLVGNPTGDLYWSYIEVKALRAAFYPLARVYGPHELLAPTAGPGSPREVLPHLPSDGYSGASLLELACHARTGASPLHSRLELAPEYGEPVVDGSLELGQLLWQFADRSSDAPGGLVVLSSCDSDLTQADHDEALTLATAFLAAGAATVVGSRWPVKDLRTAGLMFMFHHYLGGGLTPAADALRAAQLWMLDPSRSYPAEMPQSLREDLDAPDVHLDEVHAWSAFTHQGL